MSGYKHGGWIRNRKLYGVWGSMLSRCNNPNHHLYKNYGGEESKSAKNGTTLAHSENGR